MKKIAILGSTGSIGENALSVVETHPDHFSVLALAADRSVKKIEKQIRKFRPKLVALKDPNAADQLRKRIGDLTDLRVVSGVEGLIEVATFSETDLVLEAIGGSAGLLPTLSAINAGKDLAFVNKEILVMCGSLVKKAVRENGVRLLPVDSEISAIFQCLPDPIRYNEINKIVLTASGGPFRSTPKKDLFDVTPDQALKHPNWKMGAKITIDSATMMNKGLEVIEAKCLFDLELSQIDIMVHRESIIHSMIEFIDGSFLAQLGVPDMRVPIQFALTYPNRLINPADRLDWSKLRSLNFEPPDFEKFRCLKLAYDAAEIGGTLTTVLSSADEIVVRAFLDQRIGFMEIPKIIETIMQKHEVISDPTLDDILEIDRWTKENAKKMID